MGLAETELRASNPGDTVQYPDLINDQMNMLKIALNGREIRHKDTSDDEIKEALKYAMLLTGIRANNLPVEEEKMLLINFLKRNFGSHTCNEIRLAFDMAISGKLNIDARCFENFSCEYIARIMEAYRAWAKEEIKYTPKMNENKITGVVEEIQEDWSGVWQMLLSSPIETLENMFVPAYLYSWLEKEGIISLSPADKWHFVEEARHLELSELRLDYDRNRELIMLLSSQNWKKNIDAMSRLNAIAKYRAIISLIKDIKYGKRKI